jgi:hypothetical protein
VVPGYVRCPKCHAALPTVRFARRSTGPSLDPGGTTVRESQARFPLVPVLVAVLVAGSIAAFFGLRGGGSKTKTATPTELADPGRLTAPQPPTGGVGPVSEPNQPGGTRPKPPDASDIAGKLEQTLKRQRLWATVSVLGSRVDIRSATCNDPGMGPALEPSISGFKAAGLSKLRCVEPGGAVVFERDF